MDGASHVEAVGSHDQRYTTAFIDKSVYRGGFFRIAGSTKYGDSAATALSVESRWHCGRRSDLPRRRALICAEDALRRKRPLIIWKEGPASAEKC